MNRLFLALVISCLLFGFVPDLSKEEYKEAKSRCREVSQGTWNSLDTLIGAKTPNEVIITYDSVFINYWIQVWGNPSAQIAQKTYQIVDIEYHHQNPLYSLYILYDINGKEYSMMPYHIIDSIHSHIDINTANNWGANSPDSMKKEVKFNEDCSSELGIDSIKYIKCSELYMTAALGASIFRKSTNE